MRDSCGSSRVAEARLSNRGISHSVRKLLGSARSLATGRRGTPHHVVLNGAGPVESFTPRVGTLAQFASCGLVAYAIVSQGLLVVVSEELYVGDALTKRGGRRTKRASRRGTQSEHLAGGYKASISPEGGIQSWAYEASISPGAGIQSWAYKASISPGDLFAT